ncbi:MAG: LptF/LptG family permease [Cyclobacteriaceae bacterium]|nr:LptF/LptG family permease [Cyclobacteriaceae bacterium HetDA_MAG_MS6]
MKKLDWYILRQFLSTFFFVVLILVLIICVIDFTEKNDDFIKNEVPGNLIGMYYLTFFPYMSSLLTPITVFIAAVFITARLAARTEVIAILASGVSFRRMMYPYFVGAILVAMLSFYLNNYVIPEANKFRINFELAYLKKPFYFSDRNIHFKIAQNDYIYMDRYNNQRDVGYRVTLERIKDQKLFEKLNATRVEWDTATTKWRLVNWQRRQLQENGEIITAGKKLDTLLNLHPKDFDNKERLWETLTLTELNKYIQLQLSRGADDVQIYRIERYIRFMQPFTVIVLMFIGLIVSARKSRRGTGFQIALGFMIAFVFIIFFILARAIAEANTMNPLFAVWLPNIIFSVIGLIMYHTVPR